MQLRLNFLQIIISFYLLILMSIITVILDYKIFILVNSFLYISLFLYLFLINKTDLFFKLFLIILLLINLSTITTSWDARSIWLFKTKIFFYESNFFKFESHPEFTHPTYPFLGPLFASIFVKTFNFWNEIYPKIGIFFLFIPPLIYLSKTFKKNFLYACLSLVLFILGKYFFNGEMDGLISIYFLVSLILTYEIIFSKNDKDFNIIILFLNNIVISLLKFEGTVLVLIIASIFFFYFFFSKKINLKILFLIIISTLPSLIWLLYSNHLNILYSLNDSSFSLDNLINRIDNFSSFFLIFKFFVSDEKFLLSLIIFIYFYFKQKGKKDLFNLTILTNLLYLMILIIFYLSTNFDLEWHLSSSANRVIKPITLSLFVIILYNIYLKKIKNN